MNVLYFQSGGPTAVINASLAGLLRAAQSKSVKVYGARYGIEGLLTGDFVDLSGLREEEIALLSKTPGMALGSSRRNLPEDLASYEYESALERLREKGIGALLINGGNDSMLTAYRLSSYLSKTAPDIKVLGIPKTIDNDLFGSDHSLGYPSAALHVINSVKMVALDGLCFKDGKIQIVETMGRDTGWLAASSDLLLEPYRPDLILLPERRPNKEAVFALLKKAKAQKGRALVVLSEGVNPDVPSELDPFGHPSLEGAAYHWAGSIKRELGYKSRVTVLSAPSRSDPLLLSEIDYREALFSGSYALEAALEGKTGAFLSLKRLSNDPYSSSYELRPLGEIGGKVRYVPAEYLEDDTRMSKVFKDYLSPLLRPLAPSIGEKGSFPSFVLR